MNNNKKCDPSSLNGVAVWEVTSMQKSELSFMAECSAFPILWKHWTTKK